MANPVSTLLVEELRSNLRRRQQSVPPCLVSRRADAKAH